MRKFLIRWWWTSDWREHAKAHLMAAWEGHFGYVFPDPMQDLWIHNPGMSAAGIADRLEGDGFSIRDSHGFDRSLRSGLRAWIKNPFTDQEEIVLGDPPEEPRSFRPIRITSIDVKNKTVTFE